MERIATTTEQSKKLLELGIDPKSADMCYQPYISALYGNGNKCFALHVEEKSSPEQIPAWSLGALLNVIEFIKPESLVLVLTKDGDKWIMELYQRGVVKMLQGCNEIVDSAVGIIELLVQEGYLNQSRP